MQPVALIRRPSPRLAEGIVTHIDRTPVDVELAFKQHESYVEALRSAGFTIVEVAPADDCPDSVFVEDTLIVVDNLAIATRPGAPSRRPEVAGSAAAAVDAGLDLKYVEAPATLDGGDVLQVGNTIYVGRGGRTDRLGIQALRHYVEPLGRTVVPVPLKAVLHLKSAVTALPDGTFLVLPDLVPTALFPAVRPVTEEAGCHVVPLGGDRILMAASAPQTAEELRDLGFTPIVVDISEFEKLEGCVTCLSVLVSGAA
jgi:dimethylargininase